jgi:peptidoglycan/LPS O-acetylase OafA/YrhL
MVEGLVARTLHVASIHKRTMTALQADLKVTRSLPPAEGLAPPVKQSHAGLDALTTLRFLAAFRVMMYHIVNWQTKSFWLRALMDTPLGVSYFFISSGFFLTYTHSPAAARGTFDTRRFWLKRGVRILPVYYLGLIVALPLLVGGGAVTIGKTFATIFLLQAWFPASALYWNYPAWALSALAFFYLVFPALLLATRTTSRRTIWWFAALAWAATIVPGLAYAVINPDHLSVVTRYSRAPWIDVLRYNPLARLPEFVLGVLSARVYLRAGGFTTRGTAVLCAALLALSGGMVVAQLLPYTVVNNGFLDPLLIVLLAALASGGRVARALSHPWLVFLGNTSYCLYLVHAPLVYIAHALWPQYRRVPAFVAALVLVAIGVSILLHRFVEVPITRALSARLPVRPQSLGERVAA